TIVYDLDLDEFKLTKTYTIDNNALGGNVKLGGVVRCDLKIENKSQNDAECFYWINGPQGILLDIPVPEPAGSATHSQVQAELAARVRADANPSTAEPEVLQLYASSAKTDSDEGRSVTKNENLWGAVKN